MIEIRLSNKNDIHSLKEIWKICFGDDDSFIDYYFQTEFNEHQVLVLMNQGQIASMLTMLPIKLYIPNQPNYLGSMIYAVATHPKYQGMGFSTKLMDYAKSYLQNQGIHILTLVPAEKKLIDFYANRGYSIGFYTREFYISYEDIKIYSNRNETSLNIMPATATEYGTARSLLLSNMIHVIYDHDRLNHQKRLSNLASADIYIIKNIENSAIVGCTIVERISNEKVIIKELLIPDEYFEEALFNIANILPAKEYLLRLPANMGQGMGGKIREFGMVQILNPNINIDFTDQLGYLGIAYD